MKRLFIASAVFLSACASSGLEPLDLGITVSVTPSTLAVGDTVFFTANGQGVNVISLGATFGDGATDGLPVLGARSVRTTFKHVYSAAGTYTLTAQVVQADSASKSASATVIVH